jgi:hypothetical protein
MAKKKDEKAEQRALFAALEGPGLECLRKVMSNVGEPTSPATPVGTVLDVGEVPINLRARAMHLADDPDSVQILEHIFGGVGADSRRVELDDKSSRPINQWGLLCDKFFNLQTWCPVNEQEDHRVNGIDPRAAPTEPYTAEELRTLFSSLRTNYSVFYARYHASGHNEEGNGEGDDIFFKNFVRSDNVYYYMHLLFAGQAPRFCMRDLAAEQQCDVGFGEDSSFSTPSQSSNKKRRVDESLTKEDFKEFFKPSSSEVERDQKISDYFEISSRSNLLVDYERTINSSKFDLLSKEQQEIVNNKYAELLMKHLG